MKIFRLAKKRQLAWFGSCPAKPLFFLLRAQKPGIFYNCNNFSGRALSFSAAKD